MNKMVKYIFITLIILLPVVIIASIYCGHYNSTSELISAIENEDVLKVEALLEKGIDPNDTDIPRSGFWTFFEVTPKRPLAIACRIGNLEIVELLIEYGATAEYISQTGWSPLRETLFYYQPDDVRIVELLLENGAVSDEGQEESAIFAAVQMSPRVYDKTQKNGTVFSGGYDETTAKGITDIVCILLNDQSINISNASGMTLLMLSVKKENIYLTEYLISANCDVTVRDVYGRTALDYAYETGNEKLIDLLSQKTENHLLT